MTEMPAWYRQLSWRNPPVPVVELVAGLQPMTIVAEGAGLYVFTSDAADLSPRNVLYVGKADGDPNTLRQRLCVYIRRFSRPRGPPIHAGGELLEQRYRARPQALHVRWAGVVVAREIEGSLIALFDPPCNVKEEPERYADDELIPERYLYRV